MRRVILDGRQIRSRDALHDYLAQALELPSYYGANLDALHDELASEREPLHIDVHYPKTPRGKMVDYLPKLLRVFEDAARENYHLEITYQEEA